MEHTPHWLIDESHGWLVVPMDHVRASGARISPFSYASPDGRVAYLEEDSDARAYLRAVEIERTTFRNWPVRRVARAPCRGYPSIVG